LIKRRRRYALFSLTSARPKSRRPHSSHAPIRRAVVERTFYLIGNLNPTWWFMENPRGKLRKLPVMTGRAIRHTLTYCQYGDTRMKPTDIWTNAWWWTPSLMCKNGDSCHQAAPRGAKTGTQGIQGATDRSRIPAALFEEIFAQLP
jgi:hypothetical protein